MAVNLSAPRAESLHAVPGVRIGVAEAGIRKTNRKDLTVFLLDEGAAVGGVFTQNRFCAAPVQVCREHLARGDIRALVINTGCAVLLARFRSHGGSLTKAAFLSARNDAIANMAIIAAGLLTAYLWRSIWPDVIVGLGIAAMNLDAAREVWEAAHEEHEAQP